MPLELTQQEELGKKIFFDKNLSTPYGQSCATCHGAEVGYTGPNQAINANGAVYKGAVHGRFGNRKPPSAAYAGDSPVLSFDGKAWGGGMFWDGRATGWILGDPLAEQAQGPFLNPLEQNNANPEVVIYKIRNSIYKDLFLQVCTGLSTDQDYECIARSIAAYERSKEVSQFTSKYDYWLQHMVKLTGPERRGMELFNGKANCANCHVAPLFTDFSYDNLGIPKNHKNPFYYEPKWNPDGKNWVDTGLGGFLKNYGGFDYDLELGKQKVPTLRNVDKRPFKHFVKAYGHNGYFKSLQEIVHFYNTCDVPEAGWPAPEVADNVNKTELGNLNLSHGEELAIVAFLKTLSDGYDPNN
jgi:cytochrome c peroxidase